VVGEIIIFFLLPQTFSSWTNGDSPTAQASSFTLQYFPYYVWCSLDSSFCKDSIECFPYMASKFWFKPSVTISWAPTVGRCYDSLRSVWSVGRIPVGAIFSAPVQTGPGVHAVSYRMGAGFLSPGVKRPRHGADHTPPSIAEVKERVGLYLQSSSGPSWPVIGWTLIFVSLTPGG
jgi:hypothetical protein